MFEHVLLFYINVFHHFPPLFIVSVCCYEFIIQFGLLSLYFEGPSIKGQGSSDHYNYDF